MRTMCDEGRVFVLLEERYRLRRNESVIREFEGEARRECVREAGRCEMKVVEVCASEQATPCRNGQSHIVNKYSTHTDGHARCEGGFTPVGGDWAFFTFFIIKLFIVTSEAIDIHIHIIRVYKHENRDTHAYDTKTI